MAERSVVVRIRANIDDFRTGMRQAGQSAQDFGREITGRGSATREQMEQVGRGALIMSAGMLTAFGLSTKAAIDWETAWAGVLKTVDGSEEELASLEAGLRQMATELPASHAEIAAVAEAAGQLGIQTPAIEGFTRTMIDLGETTNLTAEEAATSMARLANIMQTPQTEFDRLGSTIVDLGNNTATTEAEILEMAMRIAGAGRQVGMTEADVLALAAAMSSVGIEAQAGGSSISRAMVTIASAVEQGGEKLDGFARVAGMTSEEFAAAFRDDAAGAINDFVLGLGRISESGGDVFGTLEELGLSEIRVRDAFLRLAGAGDVLTGTLDLSAQAWDENTALQDEAAQRYETTAAQMGMLRNQIVDMGIDVGQVLLPALNSLVSVAGDMVTGFAALPDSLKLVGIGLGGILTVGTGVIGVIGTMAPKVLAFKQALEGMGAAGQFAARNMRNFATATAAIGVGVTALSMWTGMMEKARREGQEFGDSMRDYVGTIQTFDEYAAAQRRVHEGQRELNREIALSTGIVNADYRASLREARNDLGGLSLAMIVNEERAKDLADAMGITRDEALQLVLRTRDLSGEQDVAAQATSDLIHSMDDDQVSAFAAELGVTEEQLRGVAEETSSARKEFEDWQNALMAATDPLFGAMDGLRGLEDAQARVAAAEWAVIEATNERDAAIRDHGEGSAEAEAAALNLMAAEQELERATFDTATAARDAEIRIENLATSMAEGGTTVEGMRENLRRWVAQGWLTEQQAAAVEKQFFMLRGTADSLPRSIHMDVTANVTNALHNLGAVAQAAQTAVNTIGKISQMPSIPQFDTGGVVPGPRGTPQLIIAHAGETILPTHKTPLSRYAVTPAHAHPTPTPRRETVERDRPDVTVQVSALTDREASRVGRKVAREIAWSQTSTGVR